MPWGPSDIVPHGGAGTLSTAGLEAPASMSALYSGNQFRTSTAWGSANEGLFQPVLVYQPCTVYGMSWVNGATASGNVDVGIYDDQLNRKVRLGSTAQGTINVAQFGNVADTFLQPGLYYFALAADNTTATFFCGSLATSLLARINGCFAMASAFSSGLVDPATNAAYTRAFLPLVVAHIEGATF